MVIIMFIILSAFCLVCSLEYSLVGKIYEKLRFLTEHPFPSFPPHQKSNVLNKKDLSLAKQMTRVLKTGFLSPWALTEKSRITHLLKPMFCG